MSKFDPDKVKETVKAVTLGKVEKDGRWDTRIAKKILETLRSVGGVNVHYDTLSMSFINDENLLPWKVYARIIPTFNLEVLLDAKAKHKIFEHFIDCLDASCGERTAMVFRVKSFAEGSSKAVVMFSPEGIELQDHTHLHIKMEDLEVCVMLFDRWLELILSWYTD